MIFDHHGTLLQRDTAKCQWAGGTMIVMLNRDSSYQQTQDFQLKDILPHIEPFGKSAAQDVVMPDPDFTIIVTWAKFLGKYNYRLFDLSEAVKLNETARIRIIWLNIDMQKSWALKPEQKLVLK
jgi:hypothetical protein